MRIGIIVILLLFNVPILSAQDCNIETFDLDSIKKYFYYKDTIIVSVANNKLSDTNRSLYDSLHKMKCFHNQLFKDYFITERIRQKKKENQIYNKTLSDSLIVKGVEGAWDYERKYGGPNFTCFSYFKSSSNWYTLTFLIEDKYLPKIILINYKPNGQFNNGRILFSSFVDAGDYYVRTSMWAEDTLMISYVIKGEKYYLEEDKYTVITDSTITKNRMLPTGEFIQIDEKTLKFEK